MSRLERWSRIKRGIEPEDPAPEPEPDKQLHNDTAADPGVADSQPLDEAPEKHESETADDSEERASAPPPPGSLDATLPDPETLEAGSDFSGYMVSGVSSTLRRRALKRLWATGNYNVRDGLDDYDLDYRQQLKPMASELAGKLRQWVKKADETLEQNADEPPASEQTALSTAKNATQHPESDDEVTATQLENGQKTVQDDQSDSSKTKA
ncbi:DUF3306 domain-containing protein [Vreelandella arcis]|uniref:DUF3306 domain-containing protein n=1 Tax=Vreelandella arcis TaxID=416873 RepID=A0A1H0IHL3_9GAMM|nr:DUF3306 domain-containing protein [Halomonas arcis]SDO30888.1 Protein of unknown function [Halomonas arcis]